MNITIRKAVETDLDVLTTLGEITFRETYSAQNTVADMEHYVSTYLNQHYTLLDLQDRNTVFYLAADHNHLPGYTKLKKMPADLLDNPGEIVELKRIYVLRQYHGHGIAQQLMQKAEMFTVEEKLKAINLAVWKENPRAIAFYLKWGFKIVGETTFDWGTGKTDSDWVMQKEIG